MKPTPSRLLSFLAAVLVATTVTVAAQAVPGADSSNVPASRELIAAYHHVFFLLTRSAGGTLPANGKPGSQLDDALRHNFGLNSSGFTTLAGAAREFRRLEFATQGQIETITRSDLLSHPKEREISSSARERIHSLFLAMAFRESDMIAAIHSALGVNEGTRLDAVAISLMGASQAWARRPPHSPLALGKSASLTSAIVQPDMSNPNDYCQYVTQEEEEEDEDECDGDGGIYSLQSCTCSNEGGGGGGGGGTDDPLVAAMIVTMADSDITYGTVPGPFIATVSNSQTEAPYPTGGVTFTIFDAVTGGPTPAITNSGEEALTLTPDETSEIASASVQWDLTTSIGAGPVFGVSAEYRVTGSYTGDDYYPKANNMTTFTVSPEGVVVKITNCPASTTTVASGQSVPISVSVTWVQAPGAGAYNVAVPTGTVTVIDTPPTGNNTEASGQLSQLIGTPSTVTIPITPTTPGLQSIKAQYQGDTNYNPGSYSDCNITVVPAG